MVRLVSSMRKLVASDESSVPVTVTGCGVRGAIEPDVVLPGVRRVVIGVERRSDGERYGRFVAAASRVTRGGG